MVRMNLIGKDVEARRGAMAQQIARVRVAIRTAQPFPLQAIMHAARTRTLAQCSRVMLRALSRFPIGAHPHQIG